MTSPVSDAMIAAGERAWHPLNKAVDFREQLRRTYLAMKAKEEAADPLETSFFDQTANSGLETFAPNQSPADDGAGRNSFVYSDDLIGLLRREGRYSGVWFAHRLIEAANEIERYRLSATPQAIEAGEAERLKIDAALALANWQKYNGNKADEIVYQAEKMASVLHDLAALSTQGEG